MKRKVNNGNGLLPGGCWFLFKHILWHSPESTFSGSAQVTVLYKEFENNASKIIATFLMGHWVNITDFDLVIHRGSKELNGYVYLYVKLFLHSPHTHLSVFVPILAYFEWRICYLLLNTKVWVLCKVGYVPQLHLKLTSHEISFDLNTRFNCPIILKRCTEHGNDQWKTQNHWVICIVGFITVCRCGVSQRGSKIMSRYKGGKVSRPELVQVMAIGL